MQDSRLQRLGFDGHWPVALAQGLICLDLIFMTRAFAMVSLIEFVLWLLFAFNHELRQRLLTALFDFKVVILTAFLLAIGVAMLWAEQAPWSERFEEWWSWRKLILFPMVFSVFQARQSKYLVLWSVVFIASVYMVLSWLGVAGLIELDRPPDYLLENDVTQGIMFSAGAFFLWILMRELAFSFWGKFISWLLILGLISNILILLPGRSGYVFLIVVSGAALWVHFNRWKWIASGIGVGLIAVTLMMSSVTRDAIIQGITEVRTVSDENAEFSSMGIRMVMWENSIEMIRRNPLLGTGTGDYRHVYADVVRDVPGWRGQLVEDPHQQYLHIWSEHGLIALGLFLFFLAVSAKNAFEMLAGAYSNFGYIALAILLATTLNGFVNGHFSSFVEGRLFWITFAAMLAGQSKIGSRDRC
jgi:O-antigen ligase